MLYIGRLKEQFYSISELSELSNFPKQQCMFLNAVSPDVTLCVVFFGAEHGLERAAGQEGEAAVRPDHSGRQ